MNRIDTDTAFLALSHILNVCIRGKDGSLILGSADIEMIEQA